MLKAPPQRFRPWLVTAAPPDKATKLGNPVHRLGQRGGLFWWSRALMDGTIQRLPFVEVQQDATGHVGHRPCQHCGIKNPPGNDITGCKPRIARCARTEGSKSVIELTWKFSVAQRLRSSA